MKKQPVKNLVLLLISCFTIFAGCEKNSSPPMVGSNHPYYIEAYLESGSFGIVNISVTQDLSQPVQGISLTRNAAVSFYKNLNATVLLLKDNLVVDTLNQLSCLGKDFLLSEDFYTLFASNTASFALDTTTRYWYLQGKSHIIEQGGNYKMIVKVPTHPDMVATCIVPQTVKIQKIDTIIGTGNYGGVQCWPRFLNQMWPPLNVFTSDSLYWSRAYTYQLTFTDPSSGQNYYQIETYFKYRLLTIAKSPPNIYDSRFNDLKFQIVSPYRENPIFENKNLDFGEIDENPFFSDKYFSGTQFTLDVHTQNTCDSIVYLNLVSMSQGYYERMKSQDLYLSNLDNTFSTPTALYSNFSNAVGFLAGRSVSSDTFKIILYTKLP